MANSFKYKSWEKAFSDSKIGQEVGKRWLKAWKKYCKVFHCNDKAETISEICGISIF